MTDNVIHLYSNRRRPHEGNQQFQLIRNRNIKRLREIENNKVPGKKGMIFKGRADRLQAALVNGALVAEAKAGGITAKEIGERFGGRFHRYSIDTGADRHIASKEPAHGLMQQISGYLKLAELLATMLGRDPDDAKIAVLERTTCWADHDATTTKNAVEEEAAGELSLLIHSMVKHVIISTGLADLLRRARRIPGAWDRTGYRFTATFSPILAEPAYAEYWAAEEEAPPLPGVALAHLLHAEANVTLVVERQGDADPGSRKLSRTDNVEREELQATIRMYRELRLVVGPTTSAEMLGPMFESRPYLEIRIKEYEGALEPIPVYPRQADLWFLEQGISIKLGGVWRRARAKQPLYPEISDVDLISKAVSGQQFEHPMYWEHAPLAHDKNRLETYYTSWTPVDEGYVLHWLDRYDREPMLVNLVPGPVLNASNMVTWFSDSTLARAVEIALATGVLEKSLEDDIARIRAALDLRESEWRDALEQSKTAQLERWNLPNEEA